MKKVYVITMEEDEKDGKIHVHRHVIGFNRFELMGLLEETQFDLMDRSRAAIPADIIREITIIKDKEVK